MELTHEWNSLKAMYHRIDMGKLQKCFQWKVTAILVFQTRFITFKTYLRQEEGHHLLQKVYQSMKIDITALTSTILLIIEYWQNPFKNDSPKYF